MKEVYIVSAVRTPIGSFGGALATISSTKLGGVAIKGALDRINIDGKIIEEVYLGSVLQANLGQAPARQAAKYAGLPDGVICTAVNKVCASGMKSITIAAQSIKSGNAEVIVAGGMENMSQVPFYLENNRWGAKYGNGVIIDGIAKDGLVDVYGNVPMGNCAELCATEYKLTREEQDAFAIESYKRSEAAWGSGKFKEEIVPVEITTKKGTVLFIEDEEYKNVKFEKIPELKPAFQKEGTVTAANASTMNDGAAALVLMTKEKMELLGLKPLAKIIGFADAAQAPEWFTTTPSIAIPKAILNAGLKKENIDYYEMNEAFAVVGLVNIKILGIAPSKVNVNGGAVSLGHPLGCSGARIVVTLINVLKQNKGKYGVASICNGGGGATAIVIENILT
ncbi:acetyl-CoA C-acyltransferase [Aurantibacillus circumpalustris]|uniref:acetyl-CoA C-acyltransferase n=1 Tax=Aurantibacillus circumpalustris TaxID=3036359 RepID=UPI00295BCD22|nr:acetyl-CoA C-acyltransferase [Aurantibacillus circumpalustris]